MQAVPSATNAALEDDHKLLTLVRRRVRSPSTARASVQATPAESAPPLITTTTTASSTRPRLAETVATIVRLGPAGEFTACPRSSNSSSDRAAVPIMVRASAADQRLRDLGRPCAEPTSWHACDYGCSGRVGRVHSVFVLLVAAAGRALTLHRRRGSLRFNEPTSPAGCFSFGIF